MKTVYIPKGETVHYESLTTEHLVVHGRLHVTYGVKAQSITGSGVIDAGSINADTVCIDDVESGTVICKRLIAKRVQAPEVFASESAAVSCFLSAAYCKFLPESIQVMLLLCCSQFFSWKRYPCIPFTRTEDADVSELTSKSLTYPCVIRV